MTFRLIKALIAITYISNFILFGTIVLFITGIVFTESGSVIFIFILTIFA